MTDELLSRVIDALDHVGARHALVGAAALAAHGVARSTFDVDLLTTDGAVLAPGVWEPMSSDPSTTVIVRRGDFDDPLAGVVRIEATGDRPIDVIVGRWPWQAEAVERAAPLRLEGVLVRVVTPPDLILLKLYAGGPQDLSDIRQLLTANADPSLPAMVQSRIDRLPAPARRAWQRLVEGE